MRRKLTFSLLLITILILVGYYFSRDVNIRSILHEKDKVLHVVNAHYLLSAFLYILTYIVIVVSSLPLTAVLTILGGFLFGLLPGATFSMLGAVVGASLSFLIFKYFLGNQFQFHYSGKLKNFNKNFEKYGAQYLILIHLFMLVPFFIINVLSSMTRVSYWTFIWTTVIGMLPSTFLYVYAGRQLRLKDSSGAIFSWKVVLIFCVMILLGLISILFKKYKEKKKV